MKMTPLRIVGLVVALGVALLVWKREPVMVSLLAMNTDQSSLDERISLIEKGFDVRLPAEGTGPFPVVLQFHGCAGIRQPFHEQWADIANDAGYAAVIVDSTTPRGISWDEALDIVCEGKTLLGQERAGDVLAAIKIAQKNPALDPSRIILAGWSHGGWSIMDFLTMDGESRIPAGLTGWSETPPTVAGSIFFYPYCGPGALSRFRPWTQNPQALAFIAGEDKVVVAEACISYFEKRRAESDLVDLVVYTDADHIFDDPFLDPEWIHWYNEEYFHDAANRYKAFLSALK